MLGEIFNLMANNKLNVLVGATLAQNTKTSLQKQLNTLGKELKGIPLGINLDEEKITKALQNISFARANQSAEAFSKNIQTATNRLTNMHTKLEDVATKMSAIALNAREVSDAFKGIGNVNIKANIKTSTSTTTSSSKKKVTENAQDSMSVFIAQQDKLLSQWEVKYSNALEKFKTKAATLKSQLKDSFDVEEYVGQYEKLNLKIQEMIKSGSSQADITKEINKTVNAMEDYVAKSKIAVKNQKELESQTKQTAKQTQIMSDSMRRFTQFYAFGEIARSGKTAMQSMFESIKDVDSSMVELKKVTDETDKTYDNFQKNAGIIAKELGTTLTDYIDATTNFKRMGVGTLAEAQEIAKVSNIMQAVAEDLDADTASSYLISTMSAFKIEAKDTIKIVDTLNNVSNNFSVTTSGLGDALVRSASSMRAANNTFEETVALITAANKITQDPKVVGKKRCPNVQQCA